MSASVEWFGMLLASAVTSNESVFPEHWSIWLASVVIIFVLIFLFIGLVDRLFAGYRTRNRRIDDDQMTPLHGGGDRRNEQLTGYVNVPDIEETIREAERKDRQSST